jgi:hypothetical protein
VSRFDPKPWAEAKAFGLEAQEAIFRYLSHQKDRRVWRADEVEGRAVYHDSHGLPIPDLISMDAGHGVALVEVKAKRDWWQEPHTNGPLSTIMEVEHIEKYAKVAERYSTRVVLVFVVRGLPKGQWASRGQAGCWWSDIQDLVPLLSTTDPALTYPLPKRERGNIGGRRVLRLQDGGPLRPLAPWDEATKSVPVDAASWAAWRILEPKSADPVVPLMLQA